MSEAATPSQTPNHLIREKSPYLLQHAHNPVDWYPWGPEAFEKARREDKPVLVSIGYATCHWCHVMEHESFSDPAVARIMNENLISIKVDREERPDVDKVYMSAVTAMTGQGGWPLNVFLTPDRKPFYGGTYFPPQGGWGRPSWSDLVTSIGRAWRDPEERRKLLSSSEQLTEALRRSLGGDTVPRSPDPACLEKGARSLRAMHDARFGGFGRSPKFPMPVYHHFLLRYGVRDKSREAGESLEISLATLRAMRRGGMYDHLGGGFHRYSTDERWHVPHFEKMLYDNAQLASVYLDAYLVSGDADFLQVARETLDYLLRDMSHPRGGFYSAEDADSLPQGAAPRDRKTEGAFYVWEKDEIVSLLGNRNGELFSEAYGVRAQGNAQADPQGEFAGRNILFRALTDVELASRFGWPEGEVRETLAGARETLRKARERRPRPERDDKILTSWNGMAISAFARAAQVTGEARYLEAARESAGFIRRKLYDESSGRIDRRWRDNHRQGPGIADDYAFLIEGLLDLYEASFEPEWFDWGVRLTEEAVRRFHDAEAGGFFMTEAGSEKEILIRVKEDSDNVEPSASSVMFQNLLRLSAVTGRRDLNGEAEKTVAGFGEALAGHPAALPRMLSGLLFMSSAPGQIVIAGDPSHEETAALLGEVRRRFLPNRVVLLADGGRGQKAMARHQPFLDELKPLSGKPTAYVCINFACELPTGDPRVLGEILDGRRGVKSND